MEERGVILFNRGNGMIVRAIVTLNSLRRYWDGPVTFYLEPPYPKEFEQVCKYYKVNVIKNDHRPDMPVLIRKTDMFTNPVYEKTLWLDIDTIVSGPIDEMFDLLDNADCVIPHFAGWWSDGRTISKRINRFEKTPVNKNYIKKALEHHPAINTGVLSFKKSDNWKKFVNDWVALALEGSKAKIFIPDEVAFQILYPSSEEWGITVKIAPTDFNVSVLHDPNSKDPRIIHYHGDKHVLDVPRCSIWKQEFENMRKDNTANINDFLKYADKRLNKYLLGGLDTTFVTAIDPHYVTFLRHTYPNWIKYKKIDKHPVIVFVNGIDIEDKSLDFLRHKNVQLIPWSMPEAETHREEMLSAFVFGTAEHVKTDYWMKLDADSFATDYSDLITEDMKQYAFCGHKWTYSRPDHIRALDSWAKSHTKAKLRRAKPMIEEGRIEGNRFYHNTKRTISFVQLHKLKFTKFCVRLLQGQKRLPAPTQDTFMFYVANRFDPETVGYKNFKKEHGFSQGNGKKDISILIERLKKIDEQNQ